MISSGLSGWGSARRGQMRVARGGCVLTVALFLGLLGSSVSQAALLNLVPDEPDVTSQFLNVSYNGGTNTFSAFGYALTVDFDGIAPPDHNIDGGGYSLTAVVDAVGNATGTIDITGTIPALGYNSGLLLSGTVDAWGFVDGGGEIFEFIFDITGGDLVADYPPAIDHRGGTIINAVNSGFAGDLGLSFANDGFSGVSDTFPIPEPASVATMLIGLGFLAMAQVYRRRR